MVMHSRTFEGNVSFDQGKSWKHIPGGIQEGNQNDNTKLVCGIEVLASGIRYSKLITGGSCTTADKVSDIAERYMGALCSSNSEAKVTVYYQDAATQEYKKFTAFKDNVSVETTKSSSVKTLNKILGAILLFLIVAAIFAGIFGKNN